MTDSGVAAPWHNRPSILSTWEHSISGFEFSGDPIVDFTDVMVKDNFQTNPFISGLPICIPRACRLTKICVNMRIQGFFSTNDPNVQIEINKNAGVCEQAFYGTPFSTQVAFLFNDAFQLNCLCIDTGGILFDECDQWYPSMFTITADPFFVMFRMLFHFELR